jgi:hypothetical protein
VTGKPLRTTGKGFSPTWRPFRTTGKPFPLAEKVCAAAGNPFPLTGKVCSIVRKPSPTTGKARAVARKGDTEAGSSLLPTLCSSLMDLEEMVGPHRRFQDGDESIAELFGEAFEQRQEIPEARVPLHLRLAASALLSQR